MITWIEGQLKSNGYTLEEAALFPDAKDEFWHTSVLDSKANPVAGGFAATKKQSRKIAIAEFLERKTYRDLVAGGEKIRKQWGLDQIPTACGFAAGFNHENTALRSVSEACERWVMSQWIDNQFKIPKLNTEKISATLDPVSVKFISHFDNVLFFKKTVDLTIGDSIFHIQVALTMGIKDRGIFPGSSAQSTGGNQWQHALLESFRHLLAVKNNPREEIRFPFDKIIYFSENAPLALQQIEKAHKLDWPDPEVSLHQVTSFENESYFLARTILKNWISWSQGPVERFLY